VSDPLTPFSDSKGISSPELIQPSLSTSHPTAQLLSIPPPTVNNSRSSFSLSDVTNNATPPDPLSPEVTSSDITVAREYLLREVGALLISNTLADGSFVETSSGFAARELKKYWDQQIGVGKDVRSPYAITAFVNQHGKSMFRVGCVSAKFCSKNPIH
jgi:Gdp/GTP exchange factor required for growth at low temperatures